jgi:hypothetical protein
MMNITTASSSRVKPGKVHRIAREGGRAVGTNLDDAASESDSKAGGIFFTNAFDVLTN